MLRTRREENQIEHKPDHGHPRKGRRAVIIGPRQIARQRRMVTAAHRRCQVIIVVGLEAPSVRRGAVCRCVRVAVAAVEVPHARITCPRIYIL